MRHLARLVVSGSILLTCAMAWAQEAAPTAGPPSPALPIQSGGFGGPTPIFGGPAAASPSKLAGNFTGGLAFEKIAEDYFLTLDLQNELGIGPVKFGVWVPLRFRIIDNDPKNGSVFRKEDWDEVSDFARLLRYVEVNLGGESWRFRGRFGALDGESIGHGTVLAGYYNSIDRDHYQAGLALSFSMRYGGVEFLLDNLFGPEIYSVRVHLRPTTFFKRTRDSTLLSRFALGLSLTQDTKAPVALHGRPNEGKPGAPIEPSFDEKRNYFLSATRPLPIFGLDFEYTILQNKLVDLVPYVDFNFLFDQRTGAGMHLGAFFNLRLPIPVLKPTLLTRLEYRAIGKGYAPRYIDSVYETQRVMYDAANLFDPTTNLPLTKLGWLRLSDPGVNGWLGELFFDFGGWVKIGGTYEDYTGPNNSALTLSLLLPKLGRIKVGASYTKRGFDSLADAFSLENALLLAYARVRIAGPLWLSANYTRTWVANPSDGKLEGFSNFSAGASVSFDY